MIDEKLGQQLHFLAEADKMKSVRRQTLLADKSREETDAEHSWHFALMAVTLFEYADIDGVNIDRVIRMALVHDLIEIYSGDTPAYDIEGNKTKEMREKAAADKVFATLPPEQAREFRALWEEFEQMETPDAIYAAAVDRLQPFLNNYLTDGHTWVKSNVSIGQVYERMAPVKIATPALWQFVEEVIRESCEKGYIKS